MAEPPSQAEHKRTHSKEIQSYTTFSMGIFFLDGGPQLAQTTLPLLPLHWKTTQDGPPPKHAWYEED